MNGRRERAVENELTASLTAATRLSSPGTAPDHRTAPSSPPSHSSSARTFPYLPLPSPLPPHQSSSPRPPPARDEFIRTVSTLRAPLFPPPYPLTAFGSLYSASTSSIHSSRPQRPQRDSDDDDALLEELEEELDNDFDLGGFRERRMMELKAQYVPLVPLIPSELELIALLPQTGRGTAVSQYGIWQADRVQGRERPHRGDSVRSATRSSTFFLFLTLSPSHSKAKRSVIHFFHRDFRRCKIMDSHLEVCRRRFRRFPFFLPADFLSSRRNLPRSTPTRSSSRLTSPTHPSSSPSSR